MNKHSFVKIVYLYLAASMYTASDEEVFEGFSAWTLPRNVPRAGGGSGGAARETTILFGEF